ncbi:MAG TPA: subclass B3 metallo-beta-lactamase, partial [Novosphingobium sp.]|nr:subclass B3 metallo-beta-lactamase [Novosphingobium sp.]
SLSAISADHYRFSDHPAYVATFRAGIARLPALPCDILITPHPSASGFRERLLRGDLTQPEGQCASYAATAGQRLDDRLAREAEARR